ncbi:MAG: DUF4286 family protein [Steroidobacteraceae bacterium]
MPGNLTYEVECTLDPDIVADYDAWLPGHVKDVLACAGFLGATIETPESAAGEPQRRLIRYRLESAGALDQYLENNATRLRTETAERFGGRVHCLRRLIKPRHDLMPASLEPANCLNCGTPVSGRHCASCGQAADVHVLSMREVAGDVTHSILHLDSRVWRTLRLLVLKPGELTREFIAGRHQRYLPPFRLYLAVSILFFALSALLPDSFDSGMSANGGSGIPEELRRELAAEGVDASTAADAASDPSQCKVDITRNPRYDDFEQAMGRACQQMRGDGGKRFFERFATTAPKLMFLFLPLIAAVALLFYWRPRRLYAEHLVLFLHNHAFTFILLGVVQVLSTLADLAIPLIGVLDLLNFLLFLWLPYYVYRSMRIVYANGRTLTILKFLSLSTIYFLLLGVTMLGGLVYAMWQLS